MSKQSNTSQPQPAEDFEFKAEIRQLLNILVHSLYTEREIFLRELLSNASDALNRIQVEMLTNRMYSDCCGMGGLLMVVDNDASDKIGKDKVRQAKETGASALVTACPACYDQFRRNADGLDVYELTDIVLQAL